jgi:outer membrane protein
MSICSARAAGNEGSDDDSGSSWGLGIGAGVTQKPYKDIDVDTMPLPIIIYDSKWFAVQGGSFSFKLPSAGPVSFSLSADVSQDGYKASDSVFLRGMDEREDMLWAGANVRWENRVADLSASWLTDVSGNSKGQKISIGIERTFSAGNWEFAPRIGAVWLDEKYVNYYYGVRQHEVTPDRAFYAPEATVNVEGGVRTSYRLPSGNSTFFLDISAQSLGKEIKESPLVDASIQPSAFVGYIYMF